MTQSSESLLSILSDIERDEKELLREQRTLHRERTGVRLHRLFSIVSLLLLMLLTLVFGGWAKLGGPHWAATAALGCVAACYLIILMQPFLIAWIHRHALRETLQLPFTACVRANVQNPMQIDKRHFPRLVALPRLDLDVGLNSLKYEALFFEKRIGWVVGSIEKIGLIPGCLAILYATGNTNTPPILATSVAWVNIIITAMGILGSVYALRYQRIISLTDLAIKNQEINEKNREKADKAEADERAAAHHLVSLPARSTEPA
jgi:hypothetical protein